MGKIIYKCKHCGKYCGEDWDGKDSGGVRTEKVDCGCKDKKKK